MSITKIEWCDLSINPVKGLCPMDCKNRDGKSYCYARRMYQRFKWNPEIRQDFSCFIGLPEEPKRIFVGSTMELFGKHIPDAWLKTIFMLCAKWPQHTFIFLTKQSYNLGWWSPFPENCWIGVSTIGFDGNSWLEEVFRDIQATVKFVSIEPLLDYSPMDFRWVNWVIVGRQTPISEKTKPRMWWLEDIVKRCDEERKPVFLKNNLRSMLPDQVPLFNKNQYELRQEYPKI